MPKIPFLFVILVFPYILNFQLFKSGEAYYFRFVW